MITLHLEHPLHRETHSLGPAPYFRIVGPSLRIGPQDQEAASYREGMWHVNGQSFINMTIASATRVRFESDGESCSETFGPFDQVKVVDGAIRHGPQFREALARLDERSQSWHVYADQKDCSTVILMAG